MSRRFLLFSQVFMLIASFLLGALMGSYLEKQATNTFRLDQSYTKGMVDSMNMLCPSVLGPVNEVIKKSKAKH